MITPSRLVPLSGTTNFRDLGGYVGHHGRFVQWRKLFRSDHLGALSSGDILMLSDLELARVADFRGSDERQQQACEKDIKQLRKRELEIVQQIEHQETALAFGKRVLETDIVLENPRLKELLEIWFEEVRLDYAGEGPRALKGIRFQLEQKQRELDFLAGALLDYASGPY
jgi:hypothetical protein